MLDNTNIFNPLALPIAIKEQFSGADALVWIRSIVISVAAWLGGYKCYHLLVWGLILIMLIWGALLPFGWNLDPKDYLDYQSRNKIETYDTYNLTGDDNG